MKWTLTLTIRFGENEPEVRDIAFDDASGSIGRIDSSVRLSNPTNLSKFVCVFAHGNPEE